MGCYSLTNTINKSCDTIVNSYILGGFLKNPIIAGLIVTFTTVLVFYLSKSDNLTNVFIISALINVVIMLFHTKAAAHSIENNQSSCNLRREYSAIRAGNKIQEEFRVENIPETNTSNDKLE